MPGLPDYAAQAQLNFTTGQQPAPVLGARYLGLLTVAPTGDAGATGSTEVAGGAYARVQVAGQLTAGAAFTTASTTITLAAGAPAWLLALGTNGSGVNVYDVTSGFQIGTVASIAGATVTLTGTAAHVSTGAADSLSFSAFPAASASVGAEPATTPASVANGAAITFPQASASWGTVVAWFLADAPAAGNWLFWDYLGNFPWLPATVSAASPGVVNAHAHGYSAADSVIVSIKAGGSLPTFAQSNLTGALAVVGPTTDTFTVTNGGVAVNTSATGDFMVRKITMQPIAQNVTFSAAANAFTLFAG
jgi:hypothetical protein